MGKSYTQEFRRVYERKFKLVIEVISSTVERNRLYEASCMGTHRAEIALGPTLIGGS
jgi:hypothetical protein